MRSKKCSLKVNGVSIEGKGEDLVRLLEVLPEDCEVRIAGQMGYFDVEDAIVWLSKRQYGERESFC